MDFIDLKTQQSLIRKEIDAAIAKVLDHGRYILGPEVGALEEALTDFCGAKHCLGVSSGTDALLIALMALEIGPGDEVITVPYTWISTAEVISLLGAKPVFVDVEPETWNLDPNLLEAAITSNTKAVMPVGIYGQTADMAPIVAIADRYKLPVIEDAAQCFGATYKGEQSCNLSTIGTTSFFPSKPLGGYGDGGAIFTSDDELAEKMRWIHVHGQKQKHHHPILGLNGRLDSIQAAIILEKLKLYPNEVTLRQKVGEAYSSGIEGSGRFTPQETREGNTSVYAQYTVLCEDRDGIQQSLKASDVPSVSYYTVPLHLQPVFSDLGHSAGDFPVTEKIAGQCLSLPMSPYLSETEINQVIEALVKVK